MEKFSLYDFLGLLLPGVLFLFFLIHLNNLFATNLFHIIPENIDTNILPLLCLALIIGAILYTSNFYLVSKTNWYNRLLGMYKHVTDLYLEMDNLHSLMNNVLNKKAKEWYGKDLFFNQTDFYNLSVSEQNQIKNLQDEFYDRIYYELEYYEKNEHSKAFHSFYFFFRQTALAFLLLLFIELLMFLFSLLAGTTSAIPHQCNLDIILFTIILFLLLIVSIWLARWYRKRMVMKIYWAYFTHLQLTKN